MSICQEYKTILLTASVTFWFRRVSLISPIQLNDPYDGSHYILHGTLILAVRLG